MVRLPGGFLLFVDIMSKEGTLCIFPFRRLHVAAIEQCDVWQVANHKRASLCFVVALHTATSKLLFI